MSHRGFHHCELVFNNCRVNKRQVLGEVHRGFDVANQWLGATRLTVAAQCVGRAQRAMEMAAQWAATRKQFGQTIGKFQGTSFKLADMATEIEAANLLCLQTAWKTDQGSVTDADYAMAKLYATEMLARVTDQTVQIFGGMGLDGRGRRRAAVARCAGRAHLGRHLRDPAPHHFPQRAASARVRLPTSRGITRRKVFATRRPLSRLRAHT